MARTRRSRTAFAASAAATLCLPAGSAQAVGVLGGADFSFGALTTDVIFSDLPASDGTGGTIFYAGS